MIVLSLRSSSIGSYSLCEQSYFLNYGLGIPNVPHNNKATKGNCVHKALELLARRKLAEQEMRAEFTDEEIEKTFLVNDLSIERAIEEGYDHYSADTAHLYPWSQTDFDDVEKWTHTALQFNGGLFNPLKRHVIWPERYFEIELPHKWARYDYEMPDGSRLRGQLVLRGTIDLVCGIDGFPGAVELVDWKTGQRKDWKTGLEKDWATLRDDHQLRLYHYVLTKLLPDKDIVVTIVFIRDGGPFTLGYGPRDLPGTERMLRDTFESIRDNREPALKTDSWFWCSKVCHYGRTLQPGSKKSICKFMRDELQQIGMDRMFERYGDLKMMRDYTGGGKSKDSE